MKTTTFWTSIKGIIGGTPEEVFLKAVLGFITLVVSLVNDVAWYAAFFLLALLLDAILGTIAAVRKGEKIDAWRWVRGPLLKGIVYVLFLAIAAIFDMIISKTPVQYMAHSPIVITASVMGIGAILWRSAGKVHEITGWNIREWMSDVAIFNRFKKKNVDVQPRDGEPS